MSFQACILCLQITLDIISCCFPAIRTFGQGKVFFAMLNSDNVEGKYHVDSPVNILLRILSFSHCHCPAARATVSCEGMIQR